MIDRVLEKIINKKKEDSYPCWVAIYYPPPPGWELFGFIPMRILLLFIVLLVELVTICFLSEKVHSLILEIIFLMLLFYIPYKTVRYYRIIQTQRKKKEVKNDYIEQRIYYLIDSLKLYDEESYEVYFYIFL